MKISKVYFSEETALLGRRMVDLSGLDGVKQQVAAFVKSTEDVRESTLINLAGPIETDVVNFIRLCRAKGRRLLRIVECKEWCEFPDYLEALDMVLLSFPTPGLLGNPEAYNDAIQMLWFAPGEIRVTCQAGSKQDVRIIQLLYSYTPNDVPFYIELVNPHRDLNQPDPRLDLLQMCRHDRFGTARIVAPSGLLRGRK